MRVPNDTLETLLFYAFRYALGRKSYVVPDTTEYLLKYRDVLSSRTREAIVREVTEAIKNEDAGMPMDVELWEEVRHILSEVTVNT